MQIKTDFIEEMISYPHRPAPVQVLVALGHIALPPARQLVGPLIPTCCYCRRIKLAGRWSHQPAPYDNATHGICPKCLAEQKSILREKRRAA